MALRKGILRNRIDKVGIELEGGWAKHPRCSEWPNLRIEHDGSVKFENAAKQEELAQIQAAHQRSKSAVEREKLHLAYTKLESEIRKMMPRHKGEIPSPPLSTSEVEAFILSCYPDTVNETCGLHVHMSFVHHLNYARIMTPEYMKEILKRLNEWSEEKKFAKDHPIWNRIQNPKHDHCAHQYLGDAQVRIRKKDFQSRGTNHSRYTAINYCYGQHKTVECRLMPMFEEKATAVEGVKLVLTTTNKFLASVREKERKHLIAVPKSAEFLERHEVVV